MRNRGIHESRSRKGQRKLVDIAWTSSRLQSALEKFLKAHEIPYARQERWDAGFVRYAVNIRDLSAAQAVLPTLQEMAKGGPE